MSGIFAFVLVVAPPTLPIWIRLACWVVLAEIFVFWAFCHSIEFRQFNASSRARSTLTILVVVTVGAVVGAIAAPIVWLVLPADAQSESDDALALKYMSQGLSKATLENSAFNGEGSVVVHCEFTNRSDKNMSLSFILMVQLPLEDGGHTGTGSQGKWKNDLMDTRSTEVLNIGRESTINGVLVFRLLPPKTLREMGLKVAFNRWEDISYDRMRLRIEDKVSGVFVLCGMHNYPPATAGFTTENANDQPTAE